MKKEKFKLSGEYFCGNKASDYAIKNGFLDYMTLAKAFIYNKIPFFSFPLIHL